MKIRCAAPSVFHVYFAAALLCAALANRFGLKAFYTLHVWAWKPNPAGTFANWHPNVSCDSFDGQQCWPGATSAPTARLEKLS